MEKTEKAYFFKDPTATIPDDCTHIYVGDEFCEHLLPDREVLLAFLDRCGQSGRQCVLATSYLSERGMQQLSRLLKAAEAANVKIGIVINDWGVLDLLRDAPIVAEIVLGRIVSSRYLAPQHLGPDQPEGIAKTAAGPLFPAYFLELLKKTNIFRIEFNFVQHLSVERSQLAAQGIKGHIHLPYAYIATSRFCSAAVEFRDYVRNPAALEHCSRFCVKALAELDHRHLGDGFFMIGNTYFRQQEITEQQLSMADRVVYSRLPEEI